MGAKDHLTDSLELISDPKLAKLLGFSLRTFARWENDESSGFPRAIVINGRNHRRRVEIEAWLRERAVASLRKSNARDRGRGAGAEACAFEDSK